MYGKENDSNKQNTDEIAEEIMYGDEDFEQYQEELPKTSPQFSVNR